MNHHEMAPADALVVSRLNSVRWRQERRADVRHDVATTTHRNRCRARMGHTKRREKILEERDLWRILAVNTPSCHRGYTDRGI
jgi:hypothetical protein